MLLRLIPKVFYADLQVGLDFFVRDLGFQVLHQDPTITVIGRDETKLYLIENAELAAQDRPELSIETDGIEDVYGEIRARAPEVLHPNGNTVERKPWGATEFAVLDPTTLCVVFRQW